MSDKKINPDTFMADMMEKMLKDPALLLEGVALNGMLDIVEKCNLPWQSIKRIASSMVNGFIISSTCTDPFDPATMNMETAEAMLVDFLTGTILNTGSADISKEMRVRIIEQVLQSVKESD